MSPDPAHLARRLVGALRAAAPAPAEQAAVASLLRPAEAVLFWGQSTADQRHALECARAVAAACPARNDLVRAALLHDIGKRHAGLGVVGRSLASIAAALHLPVSGRYAAYLGHPGRGAADLEAAGADPLVVEYARSHHGPRPVSILPEDWAALSRADRA